MNLLDCAVLDPQTSLAVTLGALQGGLDVPNDECLRQLIRNAAHVGQSLFDRPKTADTVACQPVLHYR